MHFYKYQGAGNDFILVEDEDVSSCVEKLCDRNFGIGADGVILLEDSSLADIKMRIFNADGSEAAMCGNALRCVVLHKGRETISIETKAGICYVKLLQGKIFATLPYAKEISAPITLPGGRLGYHVDTGVPHLIIYEQDLEKKDFVQVAREIRFDERFAPGGVNVSYIKVDESNIFIRTYERGVENETLACGSGSAAAAFIVRKNDKKERSS